MIGLLVVMALVLFGFNSFSKRANQRRQEERDRTLAEEMVPGVWVHTKVGFYGRFVDLDGDVVILETPSGEETYWNKMVIQSVGDLPFAMEEVQEATLFEGAEEFGGHGRPQFEEVEIFEDEPELPGDDVDSKD